MHRLFALTLLLLLAATGCRVAPQQRAILTQYEHELRRYEDLIYDLEYEYEILATENERLQAALASAEEGSAHKRDSRPRIFTPRSPSSPAQRTIPTKPDSPEEDDLAPPVIEMGPGSAKEPAAPLIPSTPAKRSVEKPVEPMVDEPPVELRAPKQNNVAPAVSPKNVEPITKPPVTTPTSDDLPPPRRPLLETPSSVNPELLPLPDKNVSQLKIVPEATQGVLATSAGGASGVQLALATLNAKGMAIPATGKLTVVVIDPQQPNESGRLGRWEIDARELRRAQHASREQLATLELPWQTVPQNRDLMLFARLELPDGTRVETNQPLPVRDDSALAQAPSGWTPRAKRTPIMAATTPVKQPAARVVSHEQKTTAEDHSPAVVKSSSPATSDEPVAVPRWSPQR